MAVDEGGGGGGGVAMRPEIRQVHSYILLTQALFFIFILSIITTILGFISLGEVLYPGSLGRWAKCASTGYSH